MRRLNYSIKTKTLILVAVFSVFGIWIAGNIVHAGDVSEGGGTSGKSLYQNMSSSQKAASDIYYYALKECVNRGYLAEGVNLDQLSGGGVRSGAWFNKKNKNPPYEAFVNLGYFIGTAGDSARSNCGDGGNWINTAYLSLWGYTDMITALCETTGAQRWDQPRDKGCPQNDGMFTGSAENFVTNRFSLSQFTSTVKSKVYAGVEPSTMRANGSEGEKAAQYIEERTVLITGCAGNAQPGSGENAKYLYNITYVDQYGVSQPGVQYYGGGSGGKSRDTKITYLSGSGGDVTKSCSDLEMSVNTNSAAYISAVRVAGGDVPPAPSGSGSGSSSSQNTCGSSIPLIGWIVCPITSAITALNDGMWAMISNMLNVNPITQTDAITNKPTPIYNAWGAIRSIANVLFVIFFLVIIFSQLTGAGITNYGIKKLLPRLIICAILVNISFVLVQVAVDLANIVGASLFNLIKSFAPAQTFSWTKFYTEIFGGTFALSAAAGVTAGIVAGATLASSVFYMVLPMALMGLLGILAAFLTLIFRQAVIPILAIIAPLAFVAYLLPNTEQWFKKWWDLLLKMLMMYPIAATIFGGCSFAAAVIIESGPNDPIKYITGLIVMSVPLFSIPFISRQGGAMLNTVGGSLNKLVEKARNPIQDWSKARADSHMANYLNDKDNKGGQQRFRGAPRRFLRASSERRKIMDTQTKADRESFEAQGIDGQIKGMTGRTVSSRAARMNAFDSQKNLAASTAFAENEARDRDFRLNGAHGKTDSFDPNQSVNTREYKSQQEKKGSEALNTQRRMDDKSLIPLRERVTTAEGNAEKATNRAKTITEGSDGVLRVRAAVKDSAEDLENTQQHNTAVIETASTDIDATDPNLTPIQREALAKIDGTTRAGLKTNKLVRKNEASATGQAVAAQNQEIADIYLTPDPTTGGVNENVIKAAGMGGVVGQVRVQAGATQEQASFQATNVAATKTYFTHEGLSTGADLSRPADEHKIMDIIMGKITPRPGGPPATLEELIAADEMMVDTGSRLGMAQTWDVIAAMSAGTEKLRRSQAFRASIAGSSKKPVFIGGGPMGQLAAGTSSDNFIKVANSALEAGKIAAEDFQLLDKDEIGIYADSVNTLGLSRIKKDELKLAIGRAKLNPDIWDKIPGEKREQMARLEKAIL